MAKSKISILIIDDNKNIVSRMIALLEEVDTISAIHTASDYEQAFRLLNQKPDLVLLDIQLSGKNGMNLLKTIKDSGGENEVIMVSNNSGGFYRWQCKEWGALHFLDKTKDFELLPGMIKGFAIRDN